MAREAQRIEAATRLGDAHAAYRAAVAAGDRAAIATARAALVRAAEVARLEADLERRRLEFSRGG